MTPLAATAHRARRCIVCPVPLVRRTPAVRSGFNVRPVASTYPGRSTFSRTRQRDRSRSARPTSSYQIGLESARQSRRLHDRLHRQSRFSPQRVQRRLVLLLPRTPRRLYDHFHAHHASASAKYTSRWVWRHSTSTNPAPASSRSMSAGSSNGRTIARLDALSPARRSRPSHVQRSSSAPQVEIATTPPGAMTRASSAVARSGSGKKNSPNAQIATSYEPSARSRCSASITAVSPGKPASASDCAASATMAGERSTPSTWPAAPTRRAAGTSAAPRPHATSSTRAPGRTSASRRAARRSGRGRPRRSGRTSERPGRTPQRARPSRHRGRRGTRLRAFVQPPAVAAPSRTPRTPGCRDRACRSERDRRRA